MYLRLSSITGSILALFFGVLGLAFALGIVGFYCQEWGITGTRKGTAWDLQFNFKYFYTLRYKILSLGGVTTLSLSSEFSRPISGRPGASPARINTLSAETAGGEATTITHLIPYGMPEPITAFIDGINTKLGTPGIDSFDEKLVFDPLQMRDIFLYVFGSFGLIFGVLTALFFFNFIRNIFCPVFINADSGKVEYRNSLYSDAKTVPVQDIRNFEVSPYRASDSPGWLKKVFGEERLQRMMEAPQRKKYQPALVLNFKDGSRTAFYGGPAKEAKEQEIAESLNRVIGAEKRPPKN